MSTPGFSHTMHELSNRIRGERERLESEHSRYFHHDDAPIPEHVIGELRREAKRADRIVSMWAWTFAAVVVGGMVGLLFWFLPPEVRGVITVIWGGSLIACAFFFRDIFKSFKGDLNG